VIYLVDTNVLLRFADRTHPLHSCVRAAVRTLRAEGHRLQATPQNYVEFWNVATRPADKNGLGLEPAAADRLLRLVERLFPMLPDVPAVYLQWHQLVVIFGVSGVQVHDARLVAAMRVHGVSHILTFNVADFVRYATLGIVAVNPLTLALEDRMA
jgi:predicted nucleic acid-binding protein